jgi:hypothetical protein
MPSTQSGPMDREDLLRAVRDEVVNATDERDEKQGDRERAEDYFYAVLPRIPEDLLGVGFSDVISTDVADAVESVLSEILPAFTQGPVEFVPLSAEDEDQASAETIAVHHVVTSRGGYMAINAACKDSLLMGAGVLKAAWEHRKVPSYQSLRDVPAMALMQPLSAGGELLDAVEDPESGTVSATIRSYRQVSQPRIEAIPLSEFLIARGSSVLAVDEARFIGQQRTVPRSDLVAWGLDPELVDELVSYKVRSTYTAREDDDDDVPAHRAMEPVMAVDAYYRIDSDGDGIAELRRIITAGGTLGTDELLYDEPWEVQPFAVGVPYLGLHTWDGVSLFDKLKSVQDVKTELMRDLLDASRRNSRGRVGAVERDANVDDLLTSVRGGVVRCKTPNGVFPLPDAQVPPALFNTLQYMDKIRRDKGGGAIDSAEQAQALVGDTAHGIERMMSAAEQVNAMVARNLAETLVVPLYKKVHALLREYQADPLMIPGKSGWNPQQPTQWEPRQDVVLSMGMSTGERGRRTAALIQISQMQTQALQAGLTGQLVGLEQVYRTLVDIGTLAGLPSPQQYWIDPASQEAQQAAQQASQTAEQDKQEQQKLALLQYQILPEVERIKSENKTEIQSMQNQMDAMKATMDYQAKTLDSRIKLLDIETRTDAQDAQRGIDIAQVEMARNETGPVK